MKKKISIIVPIYNVINYIDECLNSILNQTLKEIEIICINDGSTDGIEFKLKKYQELDSRIIIINKKNGGLSDARNFGLERATGEYIFFLDSDDFFINESVLENLYGYSFKNKVDILSTDFIYYIDKNKEKVFNDVFKKKIKILSKKDYIKKMLDYNNNMVVWNKLYKKEILENFKFKYGVKHEDLEFTPKVLIKADKIEHLNQYSVYYRQRELSITSNFNNKNYESVIEINESLIEYYKIVTDKLYKKYLVESILKNYYWSEKEKRINKIEVNFNREKEKKFLKNKFYYLNLKIILKYIFIRYKTKFK